MTTLKIKTADVEIEYTDSCQWLTKDSTDRIIEILREIGKPMAIVATKDGTTKMTWEQAMNTGKPK